MPFNKDDYTKPPFTNGLMFDPETEETEIVYVREELKNIATALGVSSMVDQVIWDYNSYPDRWDTGEWINGDTANFCWNYMTEDEMSQEGLVNEPQVVE